MLTNDTESFGFAWVRLGLGSVDSDHRLIEFRLSSTEEAIAPPPALPGWSYRKLNPEALEFHLGSASVPTVGLNDTADQAAAALATYLEAACNACMPARSRYNHGKKQVHWWSHEIADLRAESNRLRRMAQRASRRQSPHHQQLKGEHLAKRKELRIAVRTAQAKSWAELCRAVDDDPWGVPYKVVTKKIGRSRPGVEARGRESEIADLLFPVHPAVTWSHEPTPADQRDQSPPPDITAQELLEASRRLPSGKATGPDGVPNEVLRRVAQRQPQVLLRAYNTCMRTRQFPKKWKTARLVLLHKGADKPITDPSSFRPLCMLDTAGKLFERLILTRLNQHLDSTGRRAENQHGFRKGRSTTDAIERIMLAARGAALGAVQHRDICTTVSLDVKNAFNSVPWRQIDAALRENMVPTSLVHLIRSYMEDRDLLVGEQLIRRKVTCGVPQGSVLGPALWNIFYDKLLAIDVPPGVQLVAFADDVAVVGIARDGARTAELLNPVLADISRWMTEHGLALAPQKTEAIVLTNKHIFTAPDLYVEGHLIPVRRTIKYLGVELDTRLSFTHHIEMASRKAVETVRAIGRLMPNVGGPSRSKRALLGTVSASKLLYGSNVWAEAGTRTSKNRAAMARSQRQVALRTLRAYRTVSSEASSVLAQLIPADLLALERRRVAIRLSEADRSTTNNLIKIEERNISIRAWQNRWDRSSKGRWTYNLIPDIARWMRSEPAATYHLTQALTGHGSFKSYLHRMCVAEDDECGYCGEPDTAEHTLFYCIRWEDNRTKVASFLSGRPPVPADVMDLLCGPVEADERDVHLRDAFQRARVAFIEMVETIMATKEDDERYEQRYGYLHQEQ